MQPLGMVLLSAGELTFALAALWTMNAIFIALIVSGINLRFADPSMTGVQVGAAIVYMLIISYFVVELRAVVLFGVLGAALGRAR